MALSLPDNPWKDTVLTVTYGIVVFSIVVQGLTLERVALAVLRAPVIGRNFGAS
jgi:CPA1 family monovalent cation:H+ antiporter